MSIGIIGGADGPTAIFLAGGPLWPALLAGGVLAAAALFLLLRHRRKKDGRGE